ncbi:centrosomal protein of 295 kDa isoform X3 [Manis pentadactyla]|uniref:centrosomal protein of 295 kDa isoform X3 n=1 Tax=Manis pentadactyla TaxID=143292 RepID=UPI00255C5038|nr:centrosomal protein of 295 kDa isoform X3 [Manis pentadactyla]
MKRKVVNAGKLRLSPNEEAFVLKEDYERRRKLRLLQIREDIKQRRNQQFTRLAEELRTEWEESQTQKIKNLEKLYLASLRTMGEGHQQAKENEPDLNALAQRAAERKRKAEMRHKEALKVQKNRKETLMKQKTWHIKARKEALLVEKERSAKVTSLPPPPPTLFENIEVKRITNVETSSSTYHHLYSFVNREMGTKQPDPHLAAEEEAKRLEELQKQAEQQRMQQSEKAHVRGSQAMKKIHLAQNQEKLMKELKQLQQEDLARRRQTVARMPPQLLEPPYRRSEMKEDWQRELEFAFEDMYNADRKVKGNLILHLEPEPLPTMTDQIQDKELDVSMEQENLEETENIPVTEAKMICSSEAYVPLAMKTHQVPSKILFKKLLNKIRSQKSLWTIKSTSEDESEMITTISETESKTQTVESGATASEDRTLSSEQEQVVESDILTTVDSGPLSSEPRSCDADSVKEQEINETQSLTTVAQSSVLLHPQEAAARIRMAARQRQVMEIEEQKQKQLELLEQIEQQKLRLEADCFRAQLKEEKKKETQQTGVGTAPASCTVSSDKHDHRKMIRDYQHQLLQQNRFHRQSVETARKQLLDYQTMLKGKYSSMSATSLIPDSVLPIPTQKSERPPVRLEHWDQGQRPKLNPNKYQPLQPMQISELEQNYFQVLKKNHFSRRQVETTEALITSDILAKQSLESQEQLKQFSQTKTQQRDYKLFPKDSHTLSGALSHDRPLILQDARGIPETSKAATSQTLGSQQMFSENRESLSSKRTELSSLLPLAAERSFNSLPAKVESGKIQEPFSALSKSTVSVISQIQDKSLPSSETVTVQQSNVKALQEQLDLQKEVLRSKQEAQEQLLLCKQKESEGQTGLSLFLPSVLLDSFALLPHAKSESGRIQDSSPTTNDSAVSSGHPGVPQLQDRLLSFSQPILAQQGNLKLLQEQLNIQRDNLQARMEAQEVLYVRKQSELDGGVLSEQTDPPSLPSQVAKHTFTSLSSAGTQSGEIQEQYLSKRETGFLSSQSEIPKSHTGPSSFLQQLLPLHDSLKLLQKQLTAQRDALQARHKAQAELLLYRQRDLEYSKSGQMSSSFPPVVAQCAVASQASAKTEPGRIQNICFSERDHIIPSRHSVTPTLQDASLSLPPHSLPQQEKLAVPEQSHIKRVMLDTEQATEEFVHKPSELGKRISEQTGVSLSLSQVAESERFQEFMSVKSDSTVPLSHFKIPEFQQRLLRFSQHTQPQDNLEKHQERLDTEEETLPFSKKTQGGMSSEQTGLSSLIPQLGKLSLTSLSFAESSTAPGPLTTESNSKIPASHLKIPQLQDRLLRISQLIQPQQDNLKVLQEQLATQREAIVQCRRDAQEELHKQKEWRERVSSEQVGTSSFLPLVVQHSFASLPPSESGRIQEPCSAKSDNTASLGHSEIPRLSDRLLGLSQPILPQQDLTALQQEHLNARTDSLPCHEKTQKELVLPRQHRLEEQLPSEHFVQLCHSDLKALQQQLDTQWEAMGLRQEAQEEVLLQKLSKLEKRVSSEQVSSSSPLSRVPLPVADSERIPKAFPTGSNGTIPSSHPEVPRSQDGCLCSSQPVLPQQDHLTTQLVVQREATHSAEKAQEELLLDKQSELIESKSDHAVSFLSFLPKETERAFISLPFAEVKSENTCELYSSKSEHTGPSSDSAIPRFQGTLLSFSQPVLAQQDNVGLQKQLDLQKEILHYSQKVQEKLLVQRQTELQQHIRKHQETVKDFFKGSQTNKPTVENDFTQKHREWPPHLQHLARNDQENISLAGRSDSDDDPLLSGDSSAKHSGEHLDKELGRRSSKPPVAKVKCGLDLNQHELSAIQEVESPASGKISLLGKPDFYQDRDPLRVSVSREQSFLGCPLDCDPFGHVHPLAQENISGADSEAAVKVKEVVVENHAGLSYAVEEEQHTYPDPTVEPDNVETQEIYHEPLSSVTVSTGSLSYENTDVSLTNPDDLDFPELEDTFPNLHRHLFKPLEPHPDFDTSSSSGIQDSRAFYQSPDSSCENHCAPVPSKSTVSFTSLQTSLSSLYTGLTQPLDPHFADAIALSFATENFEGSEQSFQQLLPEFSSQESQHTDLPSIFSIEARDPSQGMENHNYSEQIEILQNKKIAHFQLSIGNLQSSVFSSSDEANVFHPVNLQYSTPCGSASSEISIKDQLEGKKERLGFEELTESGIDALHQGFNEDYKNESCGVSNINPHAEETDSRLCVRTVECSQNENFEDSAKAETPKITGNLSQLAQSEVFLNSRSLSLQSCIPVWETESGHGIMEEPELTLVSTSDISIAETDFANLTLEEKGQYEPSNCIQVSEFLPLASETETSDYPGVPEHSMEKTMSAETLPKPTAIPESLQEAFVKRKKKFIERSSQRQEEIKKKTRISEKSPIKIVTEKLSIGSPVSCLKVMNKVRVPLPEDRQTAQAFTHHRALRYHVCACVFMFTVLKSRLLIPYIFLTLYRVYNESVEKQQKEENAKKHDVGAQSRARAKEFRKVSRTSSFMCKVHHLTGTLSFSSIPSTENTRETSSQIYTVTFYENCRVVFIM